MNVAFHKPMSLQDFLAWESGQALRHEFDGTAPVAMTGGTAAHAALQRNLAIAIGGRLRGQPCRFFGSDLKVEVAGSIRYPDGFVVCGPVDPRSTLLREPVVVFEVLSTSTAGTDRITKNHEYAATPSIRRYVMLEQDRVAATIFARAGEDWVGHVLRADAVLDMPEIGLSLPLAELYEGLDPLPDPED
ncbi:Uma2 family endonuclease [Roseomonas sp. GC11]|uniref:Uma2 family endonuclease n=1 Tax=Roseomonas sp. GC11 TaxID=2950546 RepID=UPI00210BFAB8|nr:Uma2 family endonuclease [Roseomonas sp. GC11]MCQ4162351.1 Uma2 family endonuclease [Roseomonas sp. GC11]